MKFYIKRWDDNTVTLMTESGYVLAYFSSVFEALSACEEWYYANASEHRYEVIIDGDAEISDQLELYAA